MKMIKYLLGIVLFWTIGLPLSAQVSNNNEDGVYKIDSRHSQDYVPGQVLFKLKDGQQARVRRAAGRVQSAGISSLDKVLSEFQVQDMEQLLPHATVAKMPRRAKAYNGDMIVERDLTQLYRVVLPEEKVDQTFEMIEQLKALDEVEFAEPNYKVYIMADDNIATDFNSNPMVSQQWYLDAYGVKELWNKPIINKTRPVIAIIDTGVDITHPDLKDNIWTNQTEADGRDDYDNDRNGFKNDIHGWDFINNTPNMRDNNRHGTHVAGIAAAANNGVGIVGANPQALIMPITVMQSDGSGDVATIAKGVDYAVKNGATVINMSIGTYANSNALRQSLEKAYQTAVIVAAAGNDGRCIYTSHIHKAAPCFPAAYSFVLGVQATTTGGQVASFSNYDDDGPLFSCESTITDPDGFNYELTAPGTYILSTIPGGSYKELQGTSMASPLVAGAISALQMVKSYETQELLWGDLLHTGNIAQAYAQISRPAELDMMKVMLKERKELAEETEEDNKNNNEVNTGETVSIYPVVRTTFGSASKIKFKVIAPPNVQIIKGEADFGYSLDAFGKGVSKNPLIIKVPDDMPNASTLDLILEATCDESANTFTKHLNLRVCNMWTLKGLLTEDITLKEDHVYYVIDDVGVNEGVTMTIEAGTRVEFAKDTGLYGFGKIIANGTPEKPIIFTGHNNETWHGIYSHSGFRQSHERLEGIYTNSDSTLFTLLPTDNTPNKISTLVYYSKGSSKAKLYLSDYIDDWNPDFTCREELLTDPKYLTPGVLKMIKDWRDYYHENSATTTTYAFFEDWHVSDVDILSYCRIDGFVEPEENQSYTEPWFKDCIITPGGRANFSTTPYYISGVRNLIVDGGYYIKDIRESNIINNGGVNLAEVPGNNAFNNMYSMYSEYRYTSYEKKFANPFYLGTGRDDLLYNSISSINLAKMDLGKMSQNPIPGTHGIVWKVLVDGTDPQDEYEKMLPLGVGKHKFEVYFNRPMNKAVEPQISFGVRSPYNQIPVTEDNSWNDEGTIYTAYVTIDGKTQSDGMNRIYVRGAEDNEFFPCPYEATRFNFMVQAAGTMASGFQADAGLGCVNLTWNNENNDFEDSMGFNVYRYTEEEGGVKDTIRINEDILDISVTSYIDDNVIPGQTYYYYYKVLSTALQEYDISNIVAATPLTATRGDANGSGSVDVADVVTTVNYVTGLQPKPFVFDAADMNSDKLIDIFDVVGIIRGILNPALLTTSSLNNESAVYSIEDGVLYVDSPVALGGVQVQLTLDGRDKMEEIRVAEDLDGFETASAWLSDNDYLFLAYSMNGKSLDPGKHALLYIGDAELTSIRMSDTLGKNVNVITGETTGYDRMGSDVMNVKGIYTISGQKLSGNIVDTKKLPKGIYIINGEKFVK